MNFTETGPAHARELWRNYWMSFPGFANKGSFPDDADQKYTHDTIHTM